MSEAAERPDWPNHVVVVGAGAMGAMLGAAFAAHGTSVTLIDRRTDHVAAIEKNGLLVTGVPGERRVHPRATTSPEGVAPADLVLVLTDSAATREAARIAGAVLADGGVVLTLQNGIGNGEALSEVLPGRTVAVGSTYNSAAYVGPGHVAHTNLGGTVLGDLAGPIGPVHRRVAARLAAIGFPAEAIPDVAGHVWQKFSLNCALNPVAAATGMRSGEIYRYPPARALLEEILAEIEAVLEAKGLVLPAGNLTAHVLEHAHKRYNRPSMLQHVEMGLEPELGALNEALIAEAERLGVPTPANRTLCRIVRSIAERNRRRAVEPQIDEAALEAAALAEL